MKKCGSSAVAQGIGLFLMGAITLPAGGFSLWLAFVQPENRTETIWGIIGAILFFAAFAYCAHRVLRRGVPYVQYDEEKLVFHPSKREERAIRWDELREYALRIRIVPWLGLVFSFSRGKGKRPYEFPIYWSHQGFGEFYRQLKKRNLWREIECFGKIWE